MRLAATVPFAAALAILNATPSHAQSIPNPFNPCLRTPVPIERGQNNPAIVCDSQNQIVGQVNGADLIRRMNGGVYQMSYASTGFEGAVELFYTTTQCVGHPWLEAGFFNTSHQPVESLVQFAMLDADKNIIGGIGDITVITPLGVDEGDGVCHPLTSGAQAVVRQEGTVDTTQFVPPFTVK